MYHKSKMTLPNFEKWLKKEAAVGLLDQDRSERCRFKEEFMEIIAHEEIRWRQKARLKWLQKGITVSSSFTPLPTLAEQATGLQQ